MIHGLNFRTFTNHITFWSHFMHVSHDLVTNQSSPSMISGGCWTAIGNTIKFRK